MKLKWDPKNKAETDFAYKIFRHAVEKGDYKAKAFKPSRKGDQEVKVWDPKHRELTLVFP